ncbi:MAG: hypothetical protein US83_C0011G0049 [Candidatus Falkowbacteria bacterium GW2011_GWC2_38_22]|uniref:DUF559 domain-containing protein n=1 Tax=Candidatus Falkowbacteria bacterium GW2011_GWE1_38_31 TaxID=1618638 RepID=A0A0G0MY60_9BACT|nr:MAG: hypothetical protein US73_C0009G0049 [Candidatus Falkowbacteria bacterium GW2011_GWF2_38_1205]KKQ60931.1 MAG: hypothetical protein US83_C0011G0049 [Candidatus Falkowbacteria bacterium GW2011_GWC2_38_22]KKQ63049.1 MAG: hypothetical protein US84_C0009G0049 [Candidatus Falkowbacteria bacterium GW2011_GWF1_38_22]KKQ65071.1 MAG: hypothetical protein US87_C0009G0049 [Candidatus Falkowbacteria bacterium GW2011_GWE2_38_254]KKQ69846.1 MAG: hypothetical protein US91_C0009G0049 [Candidatus Falkowb
MSKGNNELNNLIYLSLVVIFFAIAGLFLKYAEQVFYYTKLLAIIFIIIIGIIIVILLAKKYFRILLLNKFGKIDIETAHKETATQQIIKKYYCERCKEEISKEVNDYSQKYFNKSLCKKNHHQPTFETSKLGHLLSDKYYWEVEFEKYDGYKHVDIAIDKARVYIEVDGQHHSYNQEQALADLNRDFFSFKEKYITIRIPNILTKDYKTIIRTANNLNELLKERCSQINLK